MKEVEVRSDIPLPVSKPSRYKKKGTTGTGRPSAYPFRTIEVGQSFVLDMAPLRAKGVVNTWRQKLAPKKFVTRKTEDGRVRVWRSQ